MQMAEKTPFNHLSYQQKLWKTASFRALAFLLCPSIKKPLG